MESTKDDSPLKTRFWVVRKEVYKRFKKKQQTEQQAASAALKRVMSEREWESEVIEIDITDEWIKKLSLQDFVVTC